MSNAYECDVSLCDKPPVESILGGNIQRTGTLIEKRKRRALKDQSSHRKSLLFA